MPAFSLHHLAVTAVTQVKIDLNVNKLFEDAVHALQSGVAPWIVFCLVALVMSPWIIPALSKAVAEQRSLSHRRERGIAKLRAALASRRRMVKPPQKK